MKYLKKIKPFYTDPRGSLSYLSDQKIKIKDVLLITSKKGAVRANHYHKKDTHYIYLVSGKLEYSYKDIKKSADKMTSCKVYPGELIITTPMIAHKVVALKDSLMVVLTSEPREQKKYEKEIIRLTL